MFPYTATVGFLARNKKVRIYEKIMGASRTCLPTPTLSTRLAGVCYSVVAVNLFGGRTGTTPLLRNCLTRSDREPIMMAGMRPRYALY